MAPLLKGTSGQSQGISAVSWVEKGSGSSSGARNLQERSEIQNLYPLSSFTRVLVLNQKRKKKFQYNAYRTKGLKLDNFAFFPKAKIIRCQSTMAQ